MNVLHPFHPIVWLWLAIFPAALFSADGPANVPAKDPNRVVGTVLGQPVTAKQIGLTADIDTAVKFDASDKARWDLMSSIQQKLGTPLMERFVKEQKIEATADEVAKFQATQRKQHERRKQENETKLAELTKQLAAPGLTNAQKAKLLEEQKLYHELTQFDRQGFGAQAPAAFARSLIVAWKTERDLQRKYGGRIIFQQFGPEALDARRKLFEEAEAKGDLKFDDPGVRHLFYYYSNMKHIAGDDPQALEKPWFFEDAK